VAPPDDLSHAAERAGVAPYRDLSGRTLDPWVRRSLLVLLVVLVVAALLDVFGQHPTTSRASGSAAILEVQSPANLRGGLIFQTRITVRAREALRKPTLVLQRGWFESMSVNSIVPDAAQQGTRDGKVYLTYPPLTAGRALVVWLYFQVNPTNVGKRSEDVELDDGARLLASVHRSVTIWP
jgi:hypothetical protein